MSDFCSQCTPENFDINMMEIALHLEPGRAEPLICEGCNNRGIYKDENGNLYLAKLIKGEIEEVPVKLEEL